MTLGNTPERWGTVSQLLHWVIVGLIITQFTLAYLANDLPPGLHKLVLMARHKSFGITVLGLALVRLGWRWSNPGPEVPSNLNSVEKFLARSTHFGLYACLFVMPLTGWLMSSAKKYPVSWFGLVQLPDLVAPSEKLYKALHEVHESVSYLLIALVLLHVAGALRHQFILKDNLMKRMLPGIGFVLLGLLVLLGSPKARAADWSTDNAHSKLTFAFTQAGASNTGKFDKFSVALHTASDSLAGASLDVTIDVASINTGEQERDDVLRSADLFDATKFPTSRFASPALAANGTDRYLANGKLTLRGVARQVQLPLSIRHATEAGVPVLYLTGAFTLKRLDFGIGQGDWQTTEWVGNEVPVNWSVRLVRK